MASFLRTTTTALLGHSTRTTTTTSLTSRITSPSSSTITRLISYRPNPNSKPSKPNPNQSSKIPPATRPLSRSLVPPPTITPEELQTRQWAVRRTPYAQLPVYRDWKAGGTKQVITVKKITGDKTALVEELVGKVLGGERDRIRINPVTGNIEMTGAFFDKTRDHLLERGF